MSKPRLQFERRGGALYPTDPWSLEQMCAYKEHTPLGVTITNARRLSRMGLYWAGLGLLVENIDDKRWLTTRKMHDALLEEMELVEKVYRIDGSWRTVPDSIAIDNMDDEEFEKVFETARSIVVGKWGWDPWTRWMEEHHPENLEKSRRREGSA